jgi:hypothetical protein
MDDFPVTQGLLLLGTTSVFIKINNEQFAIFGTNNILER